MVTGNVIPVYMVVCVGFRPPNRRRAPGPFRRSTPAVRHWPTASRTADDQPAKEVLIMRKLLALALGIGAAVVGIAVTMRYTRFGSGFVNDVVNPYLVRRGFSGSGPSELGTLEHVGRRTGIRRLTPLHPVRTENGFRFVVPLGERSEWVRNVVAAGHCRMQLRDVVYELDEPVVLAASELPDIAPPVAWALDRIGAEYLLLRTFAEAPGALEPVDVDQATVEPAAADAEAAETAAI